MKTKFFIIAALSISVLLSSCGPMGSASSSSSALSSTSSAQFTAGQNAGTALRNLYTQYKASGKFDYTNMNNMVSVMQLIAAAQSIKDAGKNTTAYKDFSKGLILGSVNLVTTSTADNIISAVTSQLGNVDASSLQNAASTASKTATTVNNIATVANSVNSIMGLFNK